MTGDENPDEEDPFEHLGADVDDREGDPFENLADPPREDDSTGSTSESGGTDQEETRRTPTGPDGDGWTEEFGTEAGPRPGPEKTDSGTAHATDADTARDRQSGPGPESPERDSGVGRQPEREQDPLADVGEREGDPFEESGSLFERRNVENIDPEAVWQQLASADARNAAGDAYERTFADVSKHSYCEQCEHFSPPPDVACTHEGTDIVEFLDMETVRVVDCPVVAERQELDEE